MSRRRHLGCLLGVLVLVATAGCEGVRVSDGDENDETSALPSVASKVGDTEVWDLRQRPSAAQVGITESDTSVYETRPSRPVRFRLAGGEELRLPTRYVAFSTIGSPDGKPVSVDLKTATMSLDDTVQTYRSALEQLGLPTATVAEFRRLAADATGTSWVRTDRVGGRFGDLDFGVVARYSPSSGHGLVAAGGGWL